MSAKPISALATEENRALFADYYEFTMGKSDFDHRNFATITENYFARKIPQSAYMVAAGLEQVVHHILNLHFEEQDLHWLKETSGSDFSDEFLDYLRHFRFSGDVFAVPEGTPMFPHEPMVNVTGNSIEVQLLETYLLAVMNFQTLVATKASRMVYVAKGRRCVDFGARRAHGRDAAILAARAAYIGGFVGTSLVLAGRLLGIPYVGTMAHKYVQDRDNEMKAFREYAASFPHNAILLIDTYDTIQGAKNACVVGRELEAKGYKLRGVRLDSGDISSLSKEVRKILDEAGLTYAEIFVSGDLDEFVIEKLLADKAPVDGFGIGTRLVTGANYNPFTGEGGVSALPGIYKHAERVEGGKVKPTSKVSDERAKTTLPGKKQVYRFFDEQGNMLKDVIALWGESVSGGKALLQPIIIQGELVYDFPSMPEIRNRALQELERLPEQYRRLSGFEKYPVEVSPALQALTERLVSEAKQAAPPSRGLPR